MPPGSHEQLLPLTVGSGVGFWMVFAVLLGRYGSLPRDAMLARYMLSSCICLSQASTVPKRLNVGSRKQRRTIAQGLMVF